VIQQGVKKRNDEISTGDSNVDTKRYELNIQLAQMLKGGVIMDVTNV
jgi:hypothetical protein